MSNGKAGSRTAERPDKDVSRSESDRMTQAVRVVARLARGVEVACQQAKLSLAQYRLLGFISQSPHRASELASRASVSKPTLTSLIDGLADRGLVRREQVEGDRRGIRLEVTDDGAEALRLADDLLCTRLSVLTAEDPDEHLVQGLILLGNTLEKEWKAHLAKLEERA
jgi:DNA-binding MarR family transcriptional regulator